MGAIVLMAPRTRRPAPTVDVPAQPASGDNSEVTDDALIAENFKLEDQLKAGTAKLNEWAAPIKTRMKEIEDELFARLSQRGSDSTKTDSGTAYKSTVGSVKVENREALFDFVAENWEKYGNEMMQLGAAIGPVRAYMDDNDGNLPPGVNITNFTRLNIKRS